MVTVELNGRLVTRNVSWFKKVKGQNSPSVEFEPSDDEQSVENNDRNVNRERPRRQHIMPARFHDYVT